MKKQHFILTLVLALVVMTGCGARSTGDENWVGLAADGNTVFLAWGSQVVAIDVDKQQQLWAYPAEPGKIKFLAEPEVTEDSVLIADYGESGGVFKPGVKSSVYALNKQSGMQMWRSEEIAKDRIIAAPLAENGQVFVGTADNSVVALDKTNGSQQWASIDLLQHAVWGQPAYADGKMIVSSMDHHVYAFNSADGTNLWSAELGGSASSSPVIMGDTVFVTSFDSKLHALNLSDGTEKWTAPAQGWIWGAPVLVDDHVYFADQGGIVYAIDAQSGAQSWQINVNGEINADLVAKDGTIHVPVIIRGEDDDTGKIVGLAADSGEKLWETLFNKPIFTAPVLVGDMLVVAQQDGVKGVTLEGLSLSNRQKKQLYQVGDGAEG